MDPLRDQPSRPIDRRAFLGRAAAMGVGAAGTATLRPASVRAAADTTSKRELLILQTSDLHALDPHASTYGSDMRVAT
ncbi:MAG: hypothetical protein L0221_17675, partial [Chloroflexi bacterium]|nr:hypothetical protein [Chloroflexota bacterium]